MKWCRDCAKPLVVGKNWSSSKARHKDYICKNCQAIAKKAGRDKKRAILYRYKQMKGCMLCGDHNATRLVFHAPKGHKDRMIATMLGCSWARIKAEVFRCVVVCANCHMDIHAKRRNSKRK